MIEFLPLRWSRSPAAPKPHDALRAAVRAGLGDALDAKDPRLVQALAHARAHYRDGKPAPWDPLVAAVAVVVGRRIPGPMVDLVVAESGLPAAIDALVLAESLARVAIASDADDDDPEELVFVEPDQLSLNGVVAGVAGPFAALRRAVLAASDEAHAEARRHAAKLRKTAPLPIRCALAYAFPTEPAWARADLESLPPWNELPACALLLLPSFDDLALAERLANTTLDFGNAFVDGRVAMVIERFGKAALPFARRLFVKRSGRATVVAALARFDGEDVAELMLTVAADPGAKEGVEAWVRAHPDAALPALVAAYGTGTSTKAKLLGPLLGSVIAKNRAKAIALAAKLSPRTRATLAALGATETWLPKITPAIEALLAPAPEALAKPWEAMVAWLRNGAPASGRSSVDAVATKADGDAIARLAQLARTCATNGGLACGQAIVDALEAVGSTAAVRELARITTGLSEPLLSEHAEEALRRLAPRLGLDDEDIADRGVPDYGIRSSDRGRMVLDFGPRSFRVELDATLKPKLLDAKGAPVKSLPRPNKKDDATKAARAVATWTVLRHEATAEAGRQAGRFEDAMVTGRRFSRASFLEVILAHPILGSLARRLVWSTETNRSFRVAEDASFADAKDDPFELRPADGAVRIAHPLEIPERDRGRWGDRLADYEILAPFEQLARSTTVLDDTSPSALERLFASHAQKRVGSSARHVLEAAGWLDEYHYSSLTFHRTLRGHTASIELGLPAPDGLPDTFLGASFTPPKDGALDPIALSEVLRDVGRIVRA